MNVPVCVFVCLGMAISHWPVNPAQPVKLSTAVFCRRTEGLMTTVRPPHSRRRRDQPPLIRYMGVEESALVWAARYQRRLQQAVEDYIIFHNVCFLNVFHSCEHTTTLIEKRGRQSRMFQKYFSTVNQHLKGYNVFLIVARESPGWFNDSVWRFLPFFLVRYGKWLLLYPCGSAGVQEAWITAVIDSEITQRICWIRIKFTLKTKANWFKLLIKLYFCVMG